VCVCVYNLSNLIAFGGPQTIIFKHTHFESFEPSQVSII
jgi:hypothetical protein